MRNLVDSLRDNFCDCTCRVPVEIAAANRIVELEQELAELRKAADRYSDGGHHEVCPVNGNYHARCTCGLAELDVLLQATPKVKPPQV